MIRYFCMATLVGIAAVCGSSATWSQEKEEEPARLQRPLARDAVYLGFSTVALREKSPPWAQGDPAISTTYDGREYHFASEEEKNSFLQNPLRYVPALGGNCIVTFVEQNKDVAGDLNFGAFQNDRFYFFADKPSLDRFLENPAKYENADIALNGNCLVTLADTGNMTPGDPQYTMIYGDRRLLFVSAEYLAAFAAEPEKYLRTVQEKQTQAPPATAGGSRSAEPREPQIAMSGYCPVAIKEESKWLKGQPDIALEYDGARYLFASQEHKKLFAENPFPYLPVLGGDCVVTLQTGGRRVPGKIEHAVYDDNDRLYLLAGAEEAKQFRENAVAYLNVDLAYDGNCAVCLVDSAQTTPGDPEFTSIHRGMRYQFPSAEMQDKFDADPPRYAAPADGNRQANRALKPVAGAFVTVSGVSKCAACTYHRQPLKASDTLGLAIAADDGRVFVVEDADQTYPDIYNNRFDARRVRVAGNIVKTDGRFSWIEPESLEVFK